MNAALNSNGGTVPIKRVIGAAVVAFAAHIVFQLINSVGALKQSADAFSTPEDSFWIYVGLVFVNCLIATSAGILGVYLIRSKELLLRYTVPLAVVMALFGGLSVILGVVVIGITVAQKCKSNAI